MGGFTEWLYLGVTETGFIVALVLFLLVCSGMQYYLANSSSAEKMIHFDKRDRREKKVMFVTAHPDDECMFFSPALIKLGRIAEVFVLCLSTGNYYSKGSKRKEELIKSCEILGIPDNRVIVIDEETLPDDPKCMWETEVVARHVQDTIHKHNIDMVLTFDEHGVSKHSNHRAIYHGISALQKNNINTPRIYKLITTSILRKYIGILDIPLSWMSSNCIVFVSNWSDFIQAQRAMFAHSSQLVWFRILYIFFSRYMIVNTFQPVLPSIGITNHHNHCS